MRVLLALITGVLGTLLALELLFRLLPVSTATLTDYYADPDLLTYPPHHRFQVATGWDLRNAQVLTSNGSGFAADIEFARDEQAVVLVGDSYVEGSGLDASDRPAVQLARQLPGRAVYGLGTPGTALLDYAQRIRWAAREFGVRDFVVWVEDGDARQSLCGSGQVVSRCLDPATLTPRIERMPPSGTLKRWVRHSALAQYVFSQLKFNPGRTLADLRQVFASAEPPQRRPVDEKAIRAMVDAVLDEFFAQVQPASPRRLVFALDGHRKAGDERSLPSGIERQYLLERLRARGVEVLDLEPVFFAHGASSPLSVAIGPYDSHLNGRGVQLVTQAMARALQR